MENSMKNSIINNVYYNKYIKYKHRYNNSRNLYGGNGGKNDSTYSLPKYILQALNSAVPVLNTASDPIKALTSQYPPVPIHASKEYQCEYLLKIAENLKDVEKRLLTTQTLLLKGMYQIFLLVQFLTVEEVIKSKLRQLIYSNENRILIEQKDQISANINIVRNSIASNNKFTTKYEEIFNTGLSRYKDHFLSRNYYNRIGNTNIWNLTKDELFKHFIFELFGRKAKEEYTTNKISKIPSFKYSLSELIFEEYTRDYTKNYILRHQNPVLFTVTTYYFHIFIDELNTLYGIDKCKLVHKMLIRYSKFFTNDVWDLSKHLTEDNITEIYDCIKSVLFIDSNETINNLFAGSSKIPTYPPFKENILKFETDQKIKDDQANAAMNEYMTRR